MNISNPPFGNSRGTEQMWSLTCKYRELVYVVSLPHAPIFVLTCSPTSHTWINPMYGYTYFPKTHSAFGQANGQNASILEEIWFSFVGMNLRVGKEHWIPAPRCFGPCSSLDSTSESKVSLPGQWPSARKLPLLSGQMVFSGQNTHR